MTVVIHSFDEFQLLILPFDKVLRLFKFSSEFSILLNLLFSFNEFAIKKSTMKTFKPQFKCLKEIGEHETSCIALSACFWMILIRYDCDEMFGKIIITIYLRTLTTYICQKRNRLKILFILCWATPVRQLLKNDNDSAFIINSTIFYGVIRMTLDL